jgi:hypothetical protein
MPNFLQVFIRPRNPLRQSRPMSERVPALILGIIEEADRDRATAGAASSGET